MTVPQMGFTGGGQNVAETTGRARRYERTSIVAAGGRGQRRVVVNDKRSEESVGLLSQRVSRRNTVLTSPTKGKEWKCSGKNAMVYNYSAIYHSTHDGDGDVNMEAAGHTTKL